jgi:hypothetical protein
MSSLIKISVNFVIVKSAKFPQLIVPARKMLGFPLIDLVS